MAQVVRDFVYFVFMFIKLIFIPKYSQTLAVPGRYIEVSR